MTVDGRAVSLADAVRHANADERLGSYRELREEYGGTADGERELALWCRKQRMEEEERLHWWTLLALEPDDAEAIRGLHLKRFRGMLLTAEELAEVKRDEKEAKQAAQEWLPKLKGIRRRLEHGDDLERAAAARELSAINDPRALSSIEEVFLLDAVDLATLVVETIAKMPGDAATELLARVAVDSPDEYVRAEATRALESRPYERYIPQLMARLATPIELDVNVSVEPGEPEQTAFTAYSYTGRMRPAFYNKYRQSGAYTSADVAAWGPEVQRASGVAVTGYQPERVTIHYVLSRDTADAETPDQVSGAIDASGNSRRALTIDDLREQVDRENETAAELNERIHAVLVKATHVNVMENGLQSLQQSARVDPRRWWQWWGAQMQSKHAIAAGIEVWTQTGLKPIEQLLPGDRVLTRDPASRELSFQLVIGVDQQPESDMLALHVNSRTIVASPTTPFQVAGAGWVKAADLKSGMELDGLSGSVRIESIAPFGIIARHSLLVANAPNFHVDRQGILVHDATRP